MTKHAVSLIFLVLLIFNCKNNDDNNGIDYQSNFNISFEIENEFFNSKLEGDLILSDPTGETIDMIELDNNQSYQLSIPTNGEPVFLSFIQRSQPNDSYFNINTFVVKEDMEITVAKIPNLNLNEEKASLDFSNIDYEFSSIVFNGLSIGGSGGMLSLESHVFPTDILTSLSVTGEATRKVYYKENVDDSFSDILTLNDLTDVIDSTMITYPENDYSFSKLRAKGLPTNDFYYKVSEDYGQMKTNHTHYLPISELTEFVLETSISQGDLNYYTQEHFPSFEFSYQQPDFDFNILSSSIDDIQLNEGAACNYYSLLFRNFTNQSFNVLWNFHGEFDESVATFLPNLEPYLQSLHEEYSNQELDYIHTKGYRIEEPFGYADFIESKTERFVTIIDKINKVEYVQKEN